MLNMIRRFCHYLSPPLLIFTAITALFGTGLSLTIPLLIGNAVDYILGKNAVDTANLMPVLVIMALFIIISALLQWVTSRLIYRLIARVIYRLRVDLFHHLSIISLDELDRYTRGDLTARATTDMEILADGFLQTLSQFIMGIITIIGTIILMMHINVPIALIVIILTPLSILCASIIARLSHQSFQEAAKKRGEMTGKASEILDGEKIIQSFAREEKVENDFDSINAEFETAGRRSTFFGSLSNPVTRFINAIIYAVVALVGCLVALGETPTLGTITIGGVASFLTFAGQYTKPFNEISSVVTQLQNATASARRIFAILDTPPENDDSNLPVMDTITGEITCDAVDFSYHPEMPVLSGITFHAAAGEHIALVGQTGCGKTTLTALFLRFYTPQHGQIKFDNKDITQYQRQSVRAQIGWVCADPWLFHGTIAENIAYSRPEATREEIEIAAKKSLCDGFIRRLPQGYDTIIDADGSGLSEGQQQLINIARVMLLSPPLLIFDEATSSLDPETQLQITHATARLMQGRTSLIIAHRLETIQDADQILVMDSGKIVERGCHDTLLSQGGVYATLWQRGKLGEE